MSAPSRTLKDGSLAAVCAYKLKEFAEALGVPREVMARVELPPALGLETRIPFERQIEVWEAAMRALRDPGFPIAVASRLCPSDYGVIGFACMTQSRLGDALRQAIRYTRIWSDLTGWELTEKADTATLTFRSDDSARFGMRCNTECVLAEMISAARAVSGREIVPEEVHFRHAEPSDTRAHRAFFRARIFWGREADAILFDRALLDAPLVKADPALAAFFQRHTDAILHEIAPEDGISGRLLSLLLERMRQGTPTLDEAAKSLGTSARTLRRRLQDVGTSFQEVLDRARLELAKRYLADPRMAVGEISFLLGFAEPSAFHRAFKRWTGSTPVAHREALGAPSAPRPGQ